MAYYQSWDLKEKLEEDAFTFTFLALEQEAHGLDFEQTIWDETLRRAQKHDRICIGPVLISQEPHQKTLEEGVRLGMDSYPLFGDMVKVTCLVSLEPKGKLDAVIESEMEDLMRELGEL